MSQPITSPDRIDALIELIGQVPSDFGRVIHCTHRRVLRKIVRAIVACPWEYSVTFEHNGRNYAIEGLVHIASSGCDDDDTRAAESEALRDIARTHGADIVKIAHETKMRLWRGTL